MIATLHDLQSMLAAPTTQAVALAHLQTLLDGGAWYDFNPEGWVPGASSNRMG